MEKINRLLVQYRGRDVGTMALYKKRFCAFEYDKAWLSSGFSISPFSLPLKEQVFMPKIDPFEGTFGVFADSLPDGWGRLLLDRLLVKNRVNPYELTSIERLAIVGNSGMGALTYLPEYHVESTSNSTMGYDEIAMACMDVLNASASDDRDTLFDIGEQEYRYAQCAGLCGIEMTKTRLFSSNKCSGYFGTKRFDRGKNRVHMVSVSGLLETSHRVPNLDYNILMKLTLELTKDYSEVEKLYRLMCFNVFAHNRDDHSKNFSYLYNDEDQRWQLSPAYDLTYSHSIGGEHATCVNGNGRDPGIEDILQVAKGIGIKADRAKRIAHTIQEIVVAQLGEYLK